MSWSDSDEQLYQALSLEQRLSTEGVAGFTEGTDQPSFSCSLSEIALKKRQTDWFFLRPRARWLVDPLNPWYITLLILWIPLNLLYVGFQLLRYLITARFDFTSFQQDTVQLTPDRLCFGSGRAGLGGSLSYRGIWSLGYYTNGVRINDGGRKLLLVSPAAPRLFVALTHLAPTASVKPGLGVPDGFIARCSASRTALDVSSMRRNPPSSWNAEPKEFRLPIPVQRVVGYSIAAVLVIAFFFIR